MAFPIQTKATSPALRALSELDDRMFSLLRQPVDANDIADLLGDLRAAKTLVRGELQAAYDKGRADSLEGGVS